MLIVWPIKASNLLTHVQLFVTCVSMRKVVGKIRLTVLRPISFVMFHAMQLVKIGLDQARHCAVVLILSACLDVHKTVLSWTIHTRNVTLTVSQRQLIQSKNVTITVNTV
jgi:hypothetical protein